MRASSSSCIPLYWRVMSAAMSNVSSFSRSKSWWYSATLSFSSFCDNSAFAIFSSRQSSCCSSDEMRSVARERSCSVESSPDASPLSAKGGDARVTCVSSRQARRGQGARCAACGVCARAAWLAPLPPPLSFLPFPLPFFFGAIAAAANGPRPARAPRPRDAPADGGGCACEPLRKTLRRWPARHNNMAPLVLVFYF